MFPNVSEVSNGSMEYLYAGVDLATVKLFENYSEALLKCATAGCIIYMLIGIPGNLITIIALARYKKVRNATAFFIINLSCSDLLFCCFILPLAASRFWHRAWVHGHLLCNIFPFARYTFVAVSLLTILAITINRYVMIAHPRLYPKLYKTRNIGIMIACIWIISIGLLIPTALGKFGRFGLDVHVGSCSIIKDINGKTPKRSLFLTAFLLPGVAIILCYARIFFIVRKTTKMSLPAKHKLSKENESSSGEYTTSASLRYVPGTSNIIHDQEFSDVISSEYAHGTVSFKTENSSNSRIRSETKLPLQLRRSALRKSMALLKLSLPTRKDRRLGTMIVAILISYCVCHLPITLTKVIRGRDMGPTISIVAYLLLYLSSSINPLIYVVMSNEYRKAYRNLIRPKHKATLPARINQQRS